MPKIEKIGTQWQYTLFIVIIHHSIMKASPYSGYLNLDKIFK